MECEQTVSHSQCRTQLSAEERKELIRREAAKLASTGASTKARTIDLTLRTSQESSGPTTSSTGALTKRKSKGFLQRRASKSVMQIAGSNSK